MVAARSFEGLRRWIVGDSAGARAVQEEALALSERSRRPFSVAHATTFSALLLAVEEDWAEAERLATVGIDLSTEYGFPRWRGTALAARGRALVEQGHESQGLAEIREGIDELGRAGMRLGNSLLFSLFAGACLRLKKLDEGLAATDAGLAHCRDTSDRLFEAELWRLRGAFVELGSRRGKEAPAGTIPEAEECFDRARALAPAQGAHMLGRRVRPGNVGPAVRRASGKIFSSETALQAPELIRACRAVVEMVEAVGIEPTSGNPPRQASTSIAGCLLLSPPLPPTGWLSGRPAH
jgi:hypothetical protein